MKKFLILLGKWIFLAAFLAAMVLGFLRAREYAHHKTGALTTAGQEGRP